MPPQNLPSEYPQKLAAPTAHTIDAHIQNGPRNSRNASRMRKTLIKVGLAALLIALAYLVYSYFFAYAFAFLDTRYTFSEELNREGLREYLYLPQKEAGSSATRIRVRNAGATLASPDAETAKAELRRGVTRLGYNVFYSYSIADDKDTEKNEEAAVLGYFEPKTHKVVLHRVHADQGSIIEVLYEKEFSDPAPETRAELLNIYLKETEAIGEALARFEFPAPQR